MMGYEKIKEATVGSESLKRIIRLLRTATDCDDLVWTVSGTPPYENYSAKLGNMGPQFSYIKPQGDLYKSQPR